MPIPPFNLSTSEEAAAHYRAAVAAVAVDDGEAVERALEAAVEADPAFALGHAARAIVLAQRDERDGARAALALARSLADCHPLGRHERHHVEIVAAALAGPIDRAAALLREHLMRVAVDRFASAAVRHASHDRPPLSEPTRDQEDPA